MNLLSEVLRHLKKGLISSGIFKTRKYEVSLEISRFILSILPAKSVSFGYLNTCVIWPTSYFQKCMEEPDLKKKNLLPSTTQTFSDT